MQGMLAANVSDRIAEVVEVLSYDHSLAIAAEIETNRLCGFLGAKRSGHYNSGIGIIKRGRRHADTGQRKRSGHATGTRRRVGKICLGITLAKSSRQPVKTEYSLVQ